MGKPAAPHPPNDQGVNAASHQLEDDLGTRRGGAGSDEGDYEAVEKTRSWGTGIVVYHLLSAEEGDSTSSYP